MESKDDANLMGYYGTNWGIKQNRRGKGKIGIIGEEYGNDARCRWKRYRKSQLN